MQKNLKIVIAVVVVGALISTGVVVGYVLSSASPCAGISTPTSPPSNVSVVPASTGVGVATSTSAHASATAAAARDAAALNPSYFHPTGNTPSTHRKIIQVVAGENFWGSLVSQIGGNLTNVTSIITDPNTDPHEYQASEADAEAITHANYIILNNVGYDTWGTQMIAADGETNQTVLNIGDSLGVSVTGGIVTGNPHMWYNPIYVNDSVQWMYDNLTSIEPNATTYFTDNYDNLTASLATLYSEVGLIKHDFAGTVVASTESIFVYLANATDLNLVSPPAFMEAIAEGNDPPDQSVVLFQCQLESGNVRVLVFNMQTVTPITTNMKQIATNNNVSVIGVYETIQPPTQTFQVWMGGELDGLFGALDAKQLGE